MRESQSESECVRRLGKSMRIGGRGIQRERKRERESENRMKSSYFTYTNHSDVIRYSAGPVGQREPHSQFTESCFFSRTINNNTSLLCHCLKQP